MYQQILLPTFLFWNCLVAFGTGEINKNTSQSEPSIKNITSPSMENTNIQGKTNHQDLILYIGTYTDAESEGIYRSIFNTETGDISNPELLAKVNNASFQCITGNKKQLWSVSESSEGQGEVTGFAIDAHTGNLHLLESYFTQGDGPCYVGYHEATKSVLTANYGSGNVTAIPVNKSGKLKGSSSFQQHSGNGPKLNRQKGPHAHCIKPDLNGKFIYSADLGTDKIYAYTIKKNKLELYKEISLEAGSGPRHIAFHPANKSMTVVNELNSTIAIFLPDNDGCFSEFKSSITTIPASFTENNQCADIHFSPDGQYLYASNRGHNSIAAFKVNQVTMELTPIGWMQETIKWPRNFTIAPSGNFLLVANKNSDKITVFRIDPRSGLLEFTGKELLISKPVCLNLFKLKN
jgi:6-phosphogluconolactonase